MECDLGIRHQHADLGRPLSGAIKIVLNRRVLRCSGLTDPTFCVAHGWSLGLPGYFLG